MTRILTALKIKRLKHYKSIVQQDLQLENNKLDVIKRRTTDLSGYLRLVYEQINIIVKINKKENTYFCTRCSNVYINNDYLYKHECYHRWFIHSNTPTCKTWQQSVINRNKYERELYELSDSHDTTLDTRKNLNIRLLELTNNIQIMSRKCHKCNEPKQCIQNCGCDDGHMICEDCCEDLDGKCPVCSQIIDFGTCPICMNIGHSHIEVNCGNNHKICGDCFQTIINESTTPLCPFCRIKI